MILETTSIDRPKTTSFGEVTNRRTRQQGVRKKSKSRFTEAVIKAKPQELQRSDRAESAGVKSPKEADENESIYKALSVESVPGGSNSSGTKVTIPQLPKEPRKFLALGTVSKTPALPSSHNRPTSELAYRNVNLDKKISKQIRTIQRVIKQESRRGSKGNSGILNGLNESLRKLNAARVRAEQSLSSKSYKDQDQIGSPESNNQSEKSTSREPMQTAALLEPPRQIEFGGNKALSIAVNTIEEPFESSAVLVSQDSYTRPNLVEAEVSTIKEETTMANGAISNGPKSQEERSSTSVGHEMTDGDTNEDQFFPLTKGCHHYTRRAEVDWDIQKYWDQRYSIFSLYDEGIHLTDDAWFGVTPEPVANKVAEDLAALTPHSKTVLIDMFAGAGGNVIAFALSKRWSTIVAIEKDLSVIACAQHNAFIYGVYEQITWINDDSFSYFASTSSSIDPSKTVIFASPPWGGPGYTTDKVFNLNTMSPYSIKQIHDVVKGMNLALYLPRSSDLRQIAKLAPEETKVEVVQYCMQGASKALVAYIPAAATPTS